MKWYEKAWAWFKKNWQWVLFPIGILMLLGRFFVSRGTTQVVSSELTDAADFQAGLDQEAKAKATEAKREKEEEVQQIVQKHEQEVQVLTDEQRRKVKELKDDPVALNSFLHDVGKQVRGE